MPRLQIGKGENTESDMPYLSIAIHNCEFKGSNRRIGQSNKRQKADLREVFSRRGHKKLEFLKIMDSRGWSVRGWE